MFVIVDHVPGSAVASAGTFAPSYPTGYGAGSFAAYGHKMFAEGLMNSLSQDNGDFSISFGASNFTVTYNGSTSLPAGKNIKIQLNQIGADNQAIPDISHMKRMNFSNVVRIDLGSPKTADTDGIAESQSVAAGAAFVLNGAQSDLSNDTAPIYLDVPRALTASWTTTSILTITGKDEYGDVIIEKSASGTSHTGKKAFASITSITSSASITSAIVGFGDVLGLPVYLDKVGRVIAELQDGAVLGPARDKVYLTGQWADISAADSSWTVAPVAGKITNVWTVLDGAITGADSNVTVEIGGVAVTGAAIVVANSGSAAGDVDNAVPTAANTVAAGDKIAVKTDGASSTTAIATWVLEITPTYTPVGTFVVGVQTLPTATTGDTKGTYDPAVACDGSLAFSLLVALPDPTYKGVDNYDG